MSPELSIRLANCIDSLYLEVGLEEQLAFIERNKTVETFEDLSEDDQTLIIKLEKQQINNDLNNKTDNFNPNHDAKGRFAPSAGSVSSDGFKENDYTTGEFEAFVIQPNEGKISEEDSYEVGTYIQTGHKINTALEHGHGKLTPEALGYDIFQKGSRLDWGRDRIKTIEIIDKHMTHKLPENTYLFRGAAFSKDLKAGQRIESYGYSSTTLNKKIGIEFIKHKYVNKKESLYLLKVKALEGTKGMFPVADVPKHNRYLSSEQEFVLPRNSSMKITKVSPKKTIDANTDEPRSYKELEVEYVQ